MSERKLDELLPLHADRPPIRLDEGGAVRSRQMTTDNEAWMPDNGQFSELPNRILALELKHLGIGVNDDLLGIEGAFDHDFLGFSCAERGRGA